MAFITNNGFLGGVAFDGMRKHLMQDFSKIYHLDLKGNARTSGERRREEAGNVFDDTIRVGVGVTFLIKKKEQTSQTEIYLYSVDDYLQADEKKAFLDKVGSYTNVPLKKVQPDQNYNWLTEGMSADFDAFLPMGTKEAKSSHFQEVQTIFKNYGRGVATCRDAWAYNFNQEQLAQNISRMIETYNEHVAKWQRLSQRPDVDNFVVNDETKISWSRDLKLDLKRGNFAEFEETKIRQSVYRPFTRKFLFFDRILNEEVYQFPHVFPIPDTETENLVICLVALGGKKDFHCLMTNVLPDLHLTGDSQCFPFYTYDEDGSHRRENITDWALAQFRARYQTTPLPPLLNQARGSKGMRSSPNGIFFITSMPCCTIRTTANNTPPT